MLVHRINPDLHPSRRQAQVIVGNDRDGASVAGVNPGQQSTV